MIEVNVKKDPRYRLGVREVKKISERILEEEGVEGEVELSIALVGKRKARELNRHYRKMDYLPLVLSFPGEKKKTPEGKIFLGDVVICFPAVREKALRENQLIEEAIEEILRHGIRNLLRSQ